VDAPPSSHLHFPEHSDPPPPGYPPHGGRHLVFKHNSFPERDTLLWVLSFLGLSANEGHRLSYDLLFLLQEDFLDLFSLAVSPYLDAGFFLVVSLYWIRMEEFEVPIPSSPSYLREITPI